MRTNLERFIVERLLDLDPTLSDAAGSAIYSKVVYPLLKRLGTDPLSVDIEQFVISRLADEFPNLDARSPGSAFRDMFVYPLILTLEPLRTELQFGSSQASLANVDALAEIEMDALLDNILATRQGGEYGYTSVRVFFTSPRSFGVDASIVFHTAQSVEFIATSPRTFLSSELQRSGSLYFADIPVRSVLRSESAQVGIDAIKFVRGLDGVARVTNLTASSGGLSPETNLAFLSRAQQSLTERSLNTERGIANGLRGVFSGISSLDTVGFGEPEMRRDVLQGSSVSHLGEGLGALIHTAKVTSSPSVATGIPFTNRLVVTGTSTALGIACRVGNYIRISDAEGTFTTALSRPRRIKSVQHVGATYTLTLDDFDYFTVAGGVAPFTVSNVDTTLVPTAGLNAYSRQGSQYRLVTSYLGDDYVIGAPLPFDEQLHVGAAAGELPTEAIPGRDFLVVMSAQGGFRCFPVHQVHSEQRVSVSRLDSFLTLRSKVPGVGATDFAFTPDINLMAESEGVFVQAFGSPALSNAFADVKRYDGKTVEEWGRNPGVSLVVGVNPATPDPCLVLLEGTQPDWSSRGVRVGQYIALAYPNDDFDGKIGGATGLANKPFPWHAWGRITSVVGHALTVEGLDYSTVSATGADMTAGHYRMLWTVYRGEIEVVAPDGTTALSYDEQALVPAYRVATSPGGAGVVDHKSLARYRVTGGFDADTTFTQNQAWVAAKSVWIRLGRSFADKEVDGSASPAEQLLAAHFVNLWDTYAEANPQFTRQRLSQQKSFSVDGGAPVNTAVQWASLPVLDGLTALSDVTGTPAVDPTASAAPNTSRLAGYLLPTGLSADQQVLFFTPAADANQVGGIVVGGMPGSVPFPEQFGAGLQVVDNEVHLGGMTDVYVKTSSTTPAVADPIRMQPANPIGTEVLFSGDDGVIDTTLPLTNFYSATLVTWVKNYLGIGAGATGYLEDLVVELVDVDAGAISPVSFRIAHNVANGVRTDTLFHVGATTTNLRWRVMRDCTTSLDAPLRVLQEGNNLKVVGNDLRAQSATGFLFPEDPSVTAVYLRILSGPPENRGEYVVTQRSLNLLALDRAIRSTAAGLSYQVYVKQPASVQLPLIRVSNVRLSGDNNTGLVVPYRHPIDVVASSFAGVNNDPFTSNATLENVAGYLTLTSDDNVPADIGLYDVVRLDDMSGGARYYYVIARDLAGAPKVLTLDRAMTPDPQAGGKYAFTVGHPAVGTADIVMKEPTYFEANAIETSSGRTVLSFEASTGRTLSFRPSPAEKAVIYESDALVSDVLTVAGGTSISSTGVPFFLYGARVGDEVQILSRVLYSSVKTQAQSTALTVAGKTLVLQISGVRRAVVLSGPNPTSFTSVAADINRQVGDQVRATVIGATPNIQLALSSRLPVIITSLGTPGLLTDLGFAESSNQLSASDYLRTITDILYDEGTGKTTIEWSGAITPMSPLTTPVFVRVTRKSQQRLYPADFAATPGGLWTAQIRVTSCDPFVDEQVVSGQQMSVAGYRSFGYELVVENDNYSYSVAEKVGIRVSGIMLDDTATSMFQAIALPGSSVAVEYEHSPLVRSLQNYMLLPNVRVTDDNPLVRHYWPAYALLSIRYSGDVTNKDLLRKISAYLGTRYPNLPIEVFNLVTVLERAGARYVAFPQQAAFLTYDANRVIRVVRSQDTVVLGKRFHIMEDMGLVTLQAG